MFFGGRGRAPPPLPRRPGVADGGEAVHDPEERDREAGERSDGWEAQQHVGQLQPPPQLHQRTHHRPKVRRGQVGDTQWGGETLESLC